MTAISAAIASPAPRQDATLRRAIAAAAMGNATEWFDYGIYAYGVTYIYRSLRADLRPVPVKPGRCATAAFQP